MGALFWGAITFSSGRPTARFARTKLIGYKFGGIVYEYALVLALVLVLDRYEYQQ